MRMRHRVLLVREWDWQNTGSGCCGRVGGGHEFCDAADFARSRQEMVRVGSVYEALREAFGDDECPVRSGDGSVVVIHAHLSARLGREECSLRLAPGVPGLGVELDRTGGEILRHTFEDMGFHIHLERNPREVLGNGKVTGLRFADGTQERAYHN